jgi:predicted acetylornithine/succinylornithine family transaminase
MQAKEIIKRGRQYVMNTYGRLPLVPVRGEGVWVWDEAGNRYLDFVGGLAVNSLGHCHPRVVAAITEQARTLIHCSNLYWIGPQVELARILVENSFGDRVFFANSGAEANEGAIKLARKYARVRGYHERFEIITMKKSFHGRTLAALAATGQDRYQRGFAPLPEGFKYVPFNDLEAVQQAVGPCTCGIMVEPLQGEGGVNVATPEFLHGIREICDARDMVLIFDEVQCGLGRTGKLFAYQHYGVEPDIMTLAKALGGGVPIGAVVATEEVAGAFQPGDHASTFGGNPLACAAGIAALTTILEEKLPENAARVGAYFQSRLESLAREFSCIKEVRGKGLMLGMELDIDGHPLVDACQERGLLINCVGPSVLRFLPPLTITESHVDAAIEILREVLVQYS